MPLAHKRGELLAQVQNTNRQYNLPAMGKNIAYQANRNGGPNALPTRLYKKASTSISH
jgi:hypothetical protein